jgi:hypothetical protein
MIDHLIPGKPFASPAVRTALILNGTRLADIIITASDAGREYRPGCLRLRRVGARFRVERGLRRGAPSVNGTKPL